jgi:hypothetical protein
MKLFKEYITETVGMGGVNYEKKVEAVMDRLAKEYPNFKRIESAGGAFSSAGSGDASFTINGRTINMEIKMDGNAQMGGTSINYERDADGFVGSFPDRLVDRFDFTKIKEEDVEMFSNALIPVVKYLDKLLDHFSSLGDPFYDTEEGLGFPLKVKNKDWEAAKKAGLIIPTNKKIRYNAQWIRQHYQKKNVDYIQIGGMGLFHTGNDVLGLGVPMLEGDIDIEMRPGPAGSGGKPYRSVGYRVQGRLKLAGAKSSISLDNYESAVNGLSKALNGQNSMEESAALVKGVKKLVGSGASVVSRIIAKTKKKLKKKLKDAGQQMSDIEDWIADQGKYANLMHENKEKDEIS